MSESELFHVLADLPKEEALERLAALDAAPETAERVRGLLEAESERADAVDALLDAASPRERGPRGRRLGPFVVLERLGEGGMGEVFLARRDSEFAPPVALKVLRAGGGSWSRERFDTERAVLSRLDHPAIAQLHEGGTLEDTGEPYFTMERVRGAPITEHCRAHRLGLKARLTLFARACEAVAYAQQRLVVHRDLKPGHILVTETGGLKLLDFGIAKVLAPDAAATRALPGLVSPGYGAPEQVRGEAVTTATDVFALGAVLFELLTDRPAFPGESAEARLEASLGGLGSFPSERVSADLPYPRSALRGDLDLVVATALRPDPEERYPTAAALLEDVERFLGGFPVRARPASWWTSLRKLVGRHRAKVALAAGIFLTLAGSGAAFTWQLSVARDRAEREARKAASVANFLAGLFESSDPRRAAGAEVDGRALLARGARRIAGELETEPELRGQLLAAIGRAERGLGAYEAALEHLEAAVELSEPGSLAYAQRLMLLAEATSAAGEHERALDAFETGRPILEALSARLDERAEALRLHGETLSAAGRFDEAEPLLEEAVERLRSSERPSSAPLLGAALRELGLLRHEQSRLPEAEACFRESLAIARRAHGERHPEYAATLYHLSQLLRDDARFEEARELSEETLALDRAIYGASHPLVADSMTNLGMLLVELDEREAAESLIVGALAMRRELLAPGHPDIGRSLTRLARLLHEEGRYEEAEKLYREALAFQIESLGEEHPLVGGRLDNLSWILHDRGAYEEARQMAARGLALHVKARGDDSMSAAIARLHLGRALIGLGRGADAEAPLDRALATGVRLYGERHPFPASVRRTRALALMLQGKLRRAEEDARKALQDLDGVVAPNHQRISAAKLALARVLSAAGRRREARGLWREVLELREAQLPVDHPRLARLRDLEPP